MFVEWIRLFDRGKKEDRHICCSYGTETLTNGLLLFKLDFTALLAVSALYILPLMN